MSCNTQKEEEEGREEKKNARDMMIHRYEHEHMNKPHVFSFIQ